MTIARARRALVLLSALLLTACAGSKPALFEGPPDPSGFLADYSTMRPSSRHEGAWYQQSRTLSNYHAFIVDTPVVLAGRTTRGTPISERTRATLARDLKLELETALSATHDLATAPGPGVARVRTALTSIARSRDTRDGRVLVGGASGEIEFVDTLTGRSIAAAVERDFDQDPHDPNSEDAYHDARVTFKHWSSRVAAWLRDADQLATRD
ncbi:MAG: DUF3313 family protein [Phycisphaerales bacterium]|jgi:hypothetical protein|nr:DUF3313 family protein [Phycisphaerales bacterium]